MHWCASTYHYSGLQVVSAPTGSGKTGVMELALLHLLSCNIDIYGVYQHRPGSLKAVYLAPSKALVQVSIRMYASRAETSKAHSGAYFLMYALVLLIA